MSISDNEKLAFLKKGKETEIAFAKMFNETVMATRDEDMYDHIDFKIITSIDVKRIKKVKRSNNETNEHIHWLEIKGISGHPGWVYGKADFFAFEIEKYWIVVAKDDLQNFIKENVKKEWVTKSEEAMYKLYKRDGNEDVITLVTSYDLCYIATKIFRKI